MTEQARNLASGDVGCPPDEFLTISAVAEIAYCPRSFWYEVLNGRRKARNEAVEDGMREDQKRLDRQRRETEDLVRHLGVFVEHPELGLRGQVDCVEEREGALIPVEYRHGRSPGTLTDRVALTLIALCLERSTGQDLKRGRLFFMKDRGDVEVDFDAAERARALEHVREARRLLALDDPPPNELKPACQGCSWYAHCSPDLSAASQRAERVKVVPRRRFERVLHVDERGVKLRLKGQAIVVTKEEKSVLSVGLETIDQIVLTGRGVHITTPALRQLIASGVDVALLDDLGRYSGRVVAERFRNPALRRAQHRRTLDPAFRLVTSRAIVAAKIHNQRVQLQRQKRRGEDSGDDGVLLSRMKTLASEAERAGDRDRLFGLEGNAARLYFQGLDQHLRARGFALERRSRRPPRDPFNALLSLCYSLLTKDVESALQLVGLDPTLGVYHSERYGRPALALDLMEELRPVIADAVALRLVNQKMIQDKHFSDNPGGVRISAAGRKKLYRAYEARMNEELAHPLFETRFTLRRNIEVQARLLCKVLEGDVDAYRPLRIR